MPQRYFPVPQITVRYRRKSVYPNAFVSFLLLCFVTAFPVILTGKPVLAQRKHEGDILRIFDKGRVYIITNDDAALGDMLLEGCRQRERRILTLEEWRQQPADIRRFVSAVYLINRELLPPDAHVPERCNADADELYTEVMRTVYQSGPTYEIILSAPDAAWLKQAIVEFRRLSEVPRSFQKRNVHSIAIIPSSAAAATAAMPFFTDATTAIGKAHLLPAESYAGATARMAEMDELILIDRSKTPCDSFVPVVDSLVKDRSIGKGETVAWRERKPGGRSRVVFSGPTADQLGDALRHCADPFSLSETPTVLSSARDLRSVRRVAVAGVKQGPADEELRRRLATRAATELRSLNAFEVLERSGLSEILSEIALDQAGITKAKDRARVRQMASADALLMVEITDINGRTDFSTKYKRLTPWMSSAPSTPPKPSRLKYDINISNQNLRDVAEPLLAKVVGTKTDEEYERDMRRYRRETLPQWQRQVDQYNQERRSREITWEQRITANSTVTVAGSLRLVDLTDGLVLWETTFTASDSAESPQGVKSVVTIGEDSRPGPEDVPKPNTIVPDALLDRVADNALLNGLQTMRGTALLPAGSAPAVASNSSTAPIVVSGRLLDIDGDTALIGLGEGDGVQVGDVLTIAITDTVQVRATVTRVRPRTCDAQVALDIPANLRGRLAAGQIVTKPVK